MAKVHVRGQGCSRGFRSLRESPFSLSFRGATRDEESHSAIEHLQSEILRFAQDGVEGLGMTSLKEVSA